MRGSHYDTLGVSEGADAEEIRTRYLFLMRRYHPDVNPSPLAPARAAQISEAFQVLNDSALRARHDAELARQRIATVTARSVNLFRGRTRRSRAAHRRHPLLLRYGARLVPVALLSVTAFSAWQLEQHIAGDSGAGPFYAQGDDTISEARRTVAALNAATLAEARAMPPLSRALVNKGVRAFRRIDASGGPAQLHAFSERCHRDAADTGTWDALDYCVAFDQAAFLNEAKPAVISARGDYFVDRHDRAAHLYVAKLSNLDAIGLRLDRIRDQVAASPEGRSGKRPAGILHRIVKRGRKLAGSAGDILSPAGGDHRSKPRDF